MRNEFQKEVFISRLRGLMEKRNYSVNKLSEMCDVSRRTIDYWLDDMKETSPNTKQLFKLSEALNVSVDYLIGLDDYTHFGNEEISKSTGLSDETIECLRALWKRSGHKDGVLTSGVDIDNYSWKNIEMINEIFEKNYRDIIKSLKSKKTPLRSPLALMYEYIHASRDFTYIHGVKDIDPFTDDFVPYYEDEENLKYDRISFYDKESRVIVNEMNPIGLFREYQLGEIRKKLDKYSEKYTDKEDKK